MDIVSSIADELVKIVPNATIYRDNQPQGFNEPSFYVYPIKSTGAGHLPNYEMRNYSYCVTWFPDPNYGAMEQCEVMRGKLMDEFNYIRIGNNTYRSFNKEVSISDAVIVFTFNIRYRALNVPDSIKMNELEIIGGNEFD